jgi:hypothetical protein
MTDVIVYDIYDMIEEMADLQMTHCDICGDGIVKIALRLDFNSKRGHTVDGTKHLIICLKCFDDIAELYRQNSADWHKRENQVIQRIKKSGIFE